MPDAPLLTISSSGPLFPFTPLYTTYIPFYTTKVSESRKNRTKKQEDIGHQKTGKTQYDVPVKTKRHYIYV
jgi:hypothetical protein